MKRVIARIVVLMVSICSAMQATDGVYNAVVIGSGISGLGAGLILARLQRAPLILDGDVPGGQLASAGPFENWPLYKGMDQLMAPELMESFRNQVAKEGATFVTERVVKVDFSQKPLTIWTDKGRMIKAHTVIIATGTMPKKMGVPGEAEYFGRGVSVCPLCDGPLFKEKPVSVVGGGDVAMFRAIYLTQYTDNITIICRGPELVGSLYCQKMVKDDPRIKIITNTIVTEVRGDGSKVTGLVLKDAKTGEQRYFSTDGVFMAIGFSPITDVFKGHVELTELGYIKPVSGYSKTSVEGVFASGTCMGHGYRTSLTAAGGGAMAAVDADAYLTKLFDDELSVKHLGCEGTGCCHDQNVGKFFFE